MSAGNSFPAASPTTDPVALLVRMMGRLEQKVEAQDRKLDAVLTAVRKDKVNDTWLDESLAAAMLNLEGRTLRRKCIAGDLPIHYRNTNGRAYQYNRRDLLKYQTQTSTSL
jgi:hypothetical protein